MVSNFFWWITRNGSHTFPLFTFLIKSVLLFCALTTQNAQQPLLLLNINIQCVVLLLFVVCRLLCEIVIILVLFVICRYLHYISYFLTGCYNNKSSIDKCEIMRIFNSLLCPCIHFTGQMYECICVSTFNSVKEEERAHYWRFLVVIKCMANIIIFMLGSS